jgi:hypothetical protein
MKHCVRVLSALFGFAALAITAKGQVQDQLVVKIPYEFVVAGQTLPAGSYTVKRVSEQNDRVLMIDSFENHATVLVSSSEIRQTGAYKPSVRFQILGGQRLLNRIETDSNIYTIPVPRSALLEAVAKSHNDRSAGGSGGSGR